MSFRRGILDVSRNGEGGPHHHFTEAVSLFVRAEGQVEVGRLWDRVIEGGGEPSRCGWLKDTCGLSWQVIPTALYELIGDPDPARASRAMQAMRCRRCPAGPRSTSLRPCTASRSLDLAVTRAAGAGCGMDTGAVMAWVAQYEQAWRDDDVAGLGVLFTEDAHYLRSPYAPPLDGLDAIRGFWSDPTPFTMTAEPVAVAGRDAVVRVEIRYGGDEPQEYRDLWILRFDGDGRVQHFEEWAYWPDKPFMAAATDEAAAPAAD